MPVGSLSSGCASAVLVPILGLPFEVLAVARNPRIDPCITHDTRAGACRCPTAHSGRSSECRRDAPVTDWHRPCGTGWRICGHWRMVTACGRICMHRKRINISTVLAGQRVGIKEVDEGIWIVSFMHYDLGYRTQRRLAERVGFEPTIGYSPIHAFQACAFNRSAISPSRSARNSSEPALRSAPARRRALLRCCAASEGKPPDYWTIFN
jgi:hypothetical protein